MRFAIIAVLIAVILGSALPATAKIKPAYWTGNVVHVSVDNIKVEDDTGHTLSFIILPKFKNVFSANGKTTYQQASIHNGMRVKVVYDQKVLGTRHADKIFILDPHGYPLKRL